MRGRTEDCAAIFDARKTDARFLMPDLAIATWRPLSTRRSSSRHALFYAQPDQISPGGVVVLRRQGKHYQQAYAPSDDAQGNTQNHSTRRSGLVTLIDFAPGIPLA